MSSEHDQHLHGAHLQGALAPVAASFVLFGSYLLIKALPQLTLQRIFNTYFFGLGTFAVAGGIRAPLQGLVSLSCAACLVSCLQLC